MSTTPVSRVRYDVPAGHFCVHIARDQQTGKYHVTNAEPLLQRISRIFYKITSEIRSIAQSISSRVITSGGARRTTT